MLRISLGGITLLKGLLNIRWDGEVSGPRRAQAPRTAEARDDDG
jgi:hypothetical protein